MYHEGDSSKGSHPSVDASIEILQSGGIFNEGCTKHTTCGLWAGNAFLQEKEPAVMLSAFEGYDDVQEDHVGAARKKVETNDVKPSSSSPPEPTELHASVAGANSDPSPPESTTLSQASEVNVLKLSNSINIQPDVSCSSLAAQDVVTCKSPDSLSQCAPEVSP